MYVIYFNPGSSISPSKTSISIEIHGRWNQVLFPGMYIRGHSADWCPRQTRCFFGVFTPFTVDSIISSLAFHRHPRPISEVELQKLDFGSFHPAEKKRAFFAQNTSSQRSIPFELNNPRRWSSMKGKREKKSGADGYDHGNGKYDFGYFLLLPRRANNSTIVERAKTRKNPV